MMQLLIGLSLCALLSTVDATIEIYDHYGRRVDSFQDREAAFDDEFDAMEGYLIGSEPPDACSPIAPPPILTNFTVGKFLLINGTELCGFGTKIRNAERAGYDVAVIYDPSPMPFAFIHILPIPRLEINIQVVFVSFADGISLRENYQYNKSLLYNYRVLIKPNSPDITYYMYLFGAVIGVCFFVMLLFLMCLLIKCIQERRRRRRNRLSSRQLRQIPTAKFVRGDPYVVCAICLEDYNEGEKLRILPCSHAYHTKCVDPWLMDNKRNCPLCKKKITFGDSEDDSDSEDSELISPAENSPLLPSPTSNRPAATTWGTFTNHGARADGSGPSSLPDLGIRPPFLANYRNLFDQGSQENGSALEVHVQSDEDMLLPLPCRSVNHGNEHTGEPEC